MRHIAIRWRTFGLICVLLSGCDDGSLPPTTTTTTSPPPASAVETMAGGDTAGYRAAIEPREFIFPSDHGPHPDFRSEWWYFTGHLESDDGERFGYQLTFFRQALAPQAQTRSSSWATRQLYLAHFALTDVEADVFHSFERLSRGAAGLAGAGGNRPFRVWVEDWSAESIGVEAFPLRLRATSRESPTIALDLTLEKHKPVVLQGDRGLSQKGEGAGDASYYYSLTRIAARGTIRLGDRSVPVTGISWLDREWSTSALGKGQIGWDWFSIQLDDQRELMLFQLRRADGSIDPISHGVLVAVDGSTRSLRYQDYSIEVTATWRSRHGTVYPSGWLLNIPTASLALELAPLVADQELDVSFRYWEGAVSVGGTENDKPVRGLGYVELVGYAE